MTATLIYAHDPMCSWCWGFSASWQRLSAALPRHIGVRRLLGGLAADSCAPMAADMQRHLQGVWRTIEANIPGAHFNHDFWRLCQPRRATYPACRAVIAARQQGAHHDAAMTAAIQRGYYLEARNPSDAAVLLEFAAALGLDSAQFESALHAASTQQQLEQEIATTRDLGVHGFPALLLIDGTHPNAAATATQIAVNYTDPDAMLTRILAVAGSPIG